MVQSSQGDSYIDENEDFASLLEQHEKSEGQKKVIKGRIISINGTEVLVDVNEKSEGRIQLEEIQDSNQQLKFQVGHDIDVMILSNNGERPIISHKRALRHYKIQEKIKALSDDYKDVIIEAEIVNDRNKGGYILEDSEGVQYFMPAKFSALKENSKHKGKILKVAIVNINKDEDSIVVSRKRFFDIDNKNKQENIERLRQSPEPIKGVVKKITNFGMFVEVNGTEGLVHYTEISYKGPVNPAKSFKEGDEVFVKVMDYDENKRRLSFSIKAISDDPWREIENELDVGDAISVIVSNVETYGVFVDLGNDIEGFLHISEISWDKNIKHPGEYLKVGQEIVVEVIEINTKARRLRVSLKKLTEKPFNAFCKRYKEGDTITGTIATLTDFGAFVKIGSIDGLLHNEDAFWEKSMRCKEQLKEGEKVDVKIVKIDPQRERVSLSRKLLLTSPVDEFSKTHHVNDKVVGTIRDIKEFGVFINLDKDIDALIKTEDLAPLRIDELKIGDTIEGAISIIDRENNKIRVSVKKLERKKERESINAFNTSEKMTLGDAIKHKL